MSLKRFNGWEPASETTYDYDGDGRLVRAVTRREPEWTGDERTWALALLDYEADQCPGCGGALTETTNADAEHSYDVPPPTRCHKCTALAIAQEPYAETKHGHALMWVAERR